uniref:Imidazoleglycerol-phosphate dehydratase n=1 Tax=Cucumis melo TaxID=3656 RepID=A0A9I9D4G1_CUCME
ILSILLKNTIFSKLTPIFQSFIIKEKNPSPNFDLGPPWLVEPFPMELSASPRLLSSPTSLMPLKPKFGFRVSQISSSTFHLHSSVLSLKPNYKMEFTRTVCSASSSERNGSPAAISSTASGPRVGEVKRVTKETNVSVKIDLDGSGIADSSTGIPFLDHMLDQLSSHGLFDVHVRATGDIHIDDHHTNEDVALAIGSIVVLLYDWRCSLLMKMFAMAYELALLNALGDRKGIYRFGDFSAPLDEALVHVSLDLSGRPHLSYDLEIPTQRVGTYDTQLVEHFFQSLVNTSGMTLHIRQLAGKNSHHIIEATFKAFARALRQATEYDPRRLGSVPRDFDWSNVSYESDHRCFGPVRRWMLEQEEWQMDSCMVDNRTCI